MLSIGLIVVFAMAGCLARGETMDSFNENRYEQALVEFAGSPLAISQGIEAFKAAYADLTSGQLEKQMAALYAPTIYFNDTIHTFETRDELVDYLIRTSSRITESRVEVRQTLRQDNDVFLRWTMEFRSRAMGRDVHSKSIGMTHLRFNDQGQVLLHQDFWDSGHGLYAQLPVVGFFVRRAHQQM